MPKAIFMISYSIKPDRRAEYLALVGELKSHLRGTAHKDYSVFETKGKSNSFTELYVTASLEELDSIDDQDERTESLVSKLEQCIDERTKKYSTLIET